MTGSGQTSIGCLKSLIPWCSMREQEVPFEAVPGTWQPKTAVARAVPLAARHSSILGFGFCARFPRQ